MSMESLTRAANIGSLLLTALSVITVVSSVAWAAVAAYHRRRRDARGRERRPSLLILGSGEPRVLYDIRKDSEANSSEGRVSVLAGALEKHETPTRSLESSHAR